MKWNRFGLSTISLRMVSILILASISGHSFADGDLMGMSIEELMQVDVKLVTRKPEKLQDAPAAVYVLSNDDIRRSGATSIPEALRLVPGVQVARIDANKWAISIRGMNGRFSRHLLVQIDGRTVYTPLFSGVMWEAQNVMLEDVDHIEVVRGPGGTMWGANAVNGIINIVTKSAKDTLGSLLSLSAGTEYRYGASARQGVALGDSAWLRVYAKAESFDSGRTLAGADGHDDWKRAQAGFRLDWQPSESDSLTLQGDYYEGDLNQLLYVPNITPLGLRPLSEEPSIEGGNLLLHWDHSFAQDNTFSIQLYYDYVKRKEYSFGDKQDTIDLDIQHSFKLGKRQDITWGGAYRIISDDISGAPMFAFDDLSEHNGYSSLFVQDEIQLIADYLSTAIGTKVEHNPYTGVEWQPGLRLTYTVTDRDTIWAAVSRAVRTPSRAERSMDMTQVFPENFLERGSPLAAGQILHSKKFDSESMIAYELGYRANISSKVSVDVATFINDYDNLRSVEVGGVSSQGIYTAYLDNKLHGTSYGFEVSTHWQVLDWWRLVASWSYARLDITPDASSTDRFGEDDYEDVVPKNQASLFSNMQLPGRIDLDGFLQYVSSLDDGDIPSYTTLDLRIGWQATDHVELSIVGQSLLDRSVQEFDQSTIMMTELTEVERSVYAKMTVQF